MKVRSRKLISSFIQIRNELNMRLSKKIIYPIVLVSFYFKNTLDAKYEI